MAQPPRKPADQYKPKEKLALVRSFTGGNSGIFGSKAGYNAGRLGNLDTKRIKKLNRAFENYYPATLTQYTLITPKNYKEVKALGKYAKQKTPPGTKAIAVPVTDSSHDIQVDIDLSHKEEKKRIRVRDKTLGAETYDVDIDPIEFAKNPKRVIDKLLKENPGVEMFMPKSTEWTLYNQTYSRKTLRPNILNFVHRYQVALDKDHFVTGFRLFTRSEAGAAYKDAREREAMERERQRRYRSLADAGYVKKYRASKRARQKGRR